MTVQFVDEGVDTGPILLQRPIELKYTRPMHEVTEQIHAVEHELLPRAIELIADGAVDFDPDNPRLVRIDEEANEQRRDDRRQPGATRRSRRRSGSAGR